MGGVLSGMLNIILLGVHPQPGFICDTGCSDKRVDPPLRQWAEPQKRCTLVLVLVPRTPMVLP